jgi:hypothetical protein
VSDSSTERHESRGRRLSGPRRKAVLTVHLVAALGLLGVSTVLLVGSVYAATRDDAREANAIYALLRLLTFGLDIPLAVVTLIAGATLARTSKWRIFGDRWLTAKLALYSATAILGVTLVGPSIDTMVDVTEASNPGTSSTRWRLASAAGLQVTMLLTAAALGVFKPRARMWTRFAWLQ